MTAQIDVINDVLAELGRLPVSNVLDSDAAQIIQNKLGILIPILLQKTDWNFAIKFRTDSTPLTQNFNAQDYIFTFQLPPDFGQFDRSTVLDLPYRLIDRLLLCNTNPVSYYYVVNNADYSVFTPCFFRALSLYCASEVALALTQNEELTTYLRNKYQQELGNAIVQNDMERPVFTMPYNDFDRITFI